MDPATVAMIVNTVNKLLALVGHGRNTANEIVPTQNDVGAALANINSLIQSSTTAQLQQLLEYTQQVGQHFSAFLQNVLHSGGDSRAVTQAYQTIFPLIDGTDGMGNIIRSDGGTEGSIEREIIALGGQVQPSTLTQGYGSSVANLQTPSQSFPLIPQAGLLAPTAPLSPIYSTIPQTIAAGFGDNTMTYLAIGALAFLIMRRR